MAKKIVRKSTRSPMQERSKETVEVILEATAQILKKEGLESCSTNKIAERAGISIGTLYQYFKNKEGIIQELSYRERQKDMIALQDAVNEICDFGLEGAIKKLLRVALGRIGSEPVLRQILDREVSAKKQKGMLQIRNQLAKLLTIKLTEFVKLNIPDSKAEEQLTVLVAGIEGAFYAALEIYGKDIDQDEFVDSITLMVMAYLAKVLA